MHVPLPIGVTVEPVTVHTPASAGSVHDVSSRADAEAAATAAIERFGHVDIVVNNAGISIRKPAAETTVEDIERVMAVNFFGAVYVTMALLPSMVERRAGSIVSDVPVNPVCPNVRGLASLPM